MKKLWLGALVVTGSMLIASTVTAQKTYTFGEKRGEAVPTEYEVQERRTNDVINRIADVSSQVVALRVTQEKTIEQLDKLLQASLLNLQELQKISTALGGQSGKTMAAPAGNTAAQSQGVDPQRAVMAELSRGMREQSETMKMMVTILNQMAEEQKVTNGLLSTLGKK